MEKPLLVLKNLSVSAGEKEILHHIDLTVRAGETHVLMGPNGAGKSTLGAAVMGSPALATQGEIEYRGEDVTDLSADERARRGIFLSFQNPLEVPGLKMSLFLRLALEAREGKKVRVWEFRKRMAQLMEDLHMDPAFLDRDLNAGFSGGEKKKAEMLQLLCLNPDLAILDETDSGLDVDAVRTVSGGIRRFLAQEGKGVIIITHTARILEGIEPTEVHVLVRGEMRAHGGAELLSEIDRGGFEKYLDAEVEKA